MSREGAATLDGALAGTGAKRQSRHKRRAVRAAEHGPSQRVLWRQLSGGERLECGHVGPPITRTTQHGGTVYRRCAACRDGLPVADREWFEKCWRDLAWSRLEEMQKDDERDKKALALADTEDSSPDEEQPAAPTVQQHPPVAQRSGTFLRCLHWGLDMGRIVAWLESHGRLVRFWGVTLGRWGIGVLHGPEKAQGAS